MKYRRMGKLDWEISEFSIGVLRQEETLETTGSFERKERTDTIRYAIDRGVNYINLGFPYYFSDPQKACAYVKEALTDGYADKVKTAINIPSRQISSLRELDNALDRQKGMFGLDKVDFCVIDDVYRASWEKLKSLDIAAWAVKTIGSGKADHISLKFHDIPHYLRGITDTYPQWAFVQIEFSILDYKHHPGAGCFKYLEDHDIAVIATDITKAGRLLRNMPGSVRSILEESGRKMTMEERCIRWALSFGDISSAQLSVNAELRSTEQVDAYLGYVAGLFPGDADIWEMLDATKIREAYYACRDYRCTACRCCTPCTTGIDMPRLIELVNDGKMYSDDAIPRFQFNNERHQNIKCTQCGECNLQCPKFVPLQKAVNEAYEKYAPCMYGKE